jgi:hypothetical protein
VAVADVAGGDVDLGLISPYLAWKWGGGWSSKYMAMMIP